MRRITLRNGHSMEPIVRPSERPVALRGGRFGVQPIIFDHVKGVVVQVGSDPESAKQYAELVAAQRPETGGESEQDSDE